MNVTPNTVSKITLAVASKPKNSRTILTACTSAIIHFISESRLDNVSVHIYKILCRHSGAEYLIVAYSSQFEADKTSKGCNINKIVFKFYFKAFSKLILRN